MLCLVCFHGTERGGEGFPEGEGEDVGRFGVDSDDSEGRSGVESDQGGVGEVSMVVVVGIPVGVGIGIEGVAKDIPGPRSGTAARVWHARGMSSSVSEG